VPSLEVGPNRDQVPGALSAACSGTGGLARPSLTPPMSPIAPARPAKTAATITAASQPGTISASARIAPAGH
jgi:hypothetical protein